MEFIQRKLKQLEDMAGTMKRANMQLANPKGDYKPLRTFKGQSNFSTFDEELDSTDEDNDQEVNFAS